MAQETIKDQSPETQSPGSIRNPYAGLLEVAKPSDLITPETDIALALGRQDRPLSRRELIRRAFLYGLLASGVGALFEAVNGVNEGRGFIEGAPEYANNPVVSGPIYYGEMAAPAKAGLGFVRVELGDSVQWGYDRGKQVSMSRMLTDDVNRMLVASGAPPLNPGGVYWFNFMMARPGATTQQIAAQAASLSKAMSQVHKYIGPWEAGVSMGGNDALNYFSEHMTPSKIGSLISDFPAFLRDFRARSELVIAALANMRHMESLSGLERIVVTGIPDIGRSQELWFMDIPGVGSLLRRIGTAACKYMNQTLIEAIEEARRSTGLEIYMDDMFNIPVSDIHPTDKGYREAVHRQESRRYGVFPDSKEPRSFRKEAEDNNVPDIPPRPEPTQSLKT